MKDPLGVEVAHALQGARRWEFSGNTCTVAAATTLAWAHCPCLSYNSAPNSRSSGDPNAEAQRPGKKSHGKWEQEGSPRHTSATTLRPPPNCPHLALLPPEEETKKDGPSGGGGQ